MPYAVLLRESRSKILAALAFAALSLLAMRVVFWLMSGPNLCAVGGAVTFNGTPIPEGAIVFDPISDGQRREAVVKDGRYLLPQKAGLSRNKEYLVRIRAFRKTGKKYINADPSASADEYEQYLPERYNAGSDIRLTASPQSLAKDFDVALTGTSKP
jgi:hypothetical protein